ncbi:MAG: hypothetical protein SFT91_05685 [Rickettsiaceae bacterium]|nr:hypothetical protein [Rickettsiaceae bacterium]
MHPTIDLTTEGLCLAALNNHVWTRDQIIGESSANCVILTSV